MTDQFDEMLEENGEDVMAESATPGGALAIYSDKPEFSQDDVFIPKLRLAQGLTAEVQDGSARPGQFVVSGFPPVEEVNIIPLMYARTRELRDQDTRGVLCFSRDAMVGVGEPGGDCSECPHAKFTGDGKNKKPPECMFSYSYVVYSKEHESVLSLQFSKTGLNSGKMLNTIVAHHGLCSRGAVISADQRQGPRGNYFIPKIKVMADTPEELLADAKAAISAAF